MPLCVCVRTCSKVDSGDSVAPSYQQSKSARYWNVDALWSRVAIKSPTGNASAASAAKAKATGGAQK